MITPDIDHDIPLADYPPTYADLKDRVDAAFASLAELGGDVVVTDDDEQAARDVAVGARAATDALLASPGTVVHLKAILSEYDKAVVESASQIRVFVTNKLLVETTSPDPKVRLKALELLGKISDVGLFTEKTEITMRHRPTEELEQLLRERLTKQIDGTDYVLPAREAPAQPLSLNVEDLTPNADAS